MILRKIRLANVRRFDEPVEIGGIGPGLNVLCEPNEHGKSTVFDALHALFFEAFKSANKTVERLRPHAGGDPEVAVEIDHEGRLISIEKRWGRGKTARVLDNGRLVAQADDAERFIADLIKPTKVGGPAGLLWVKQSATEFPKKLENDEAHRSRRDLLASVAGEVELMTGGRTMEAVLARTAEALGRLVTSKGQKKDGPLYAAAERVAALTAARDALARKEAELREAIGTRAVLRRRRAALADPAEHKARQHRLAAAQKAHAEAERHRAAVERAEGAVREAQHVADRAREALASFTAVLGEIEAAERDVAAAAVEAGVVATSQERCAAAFSAARGAHEAARARAAAAVAALSLANRAARAADAAERRADLVGREARARTFAAESEAADAAAKAALPEKSAATLLDLAEELRREEAAAFARAPAVTVRYLPGAAGAVSIAGEALGEGERRPLPGGGTLSVAGVGTLEVHPGGAATAGSLDASERRLAEALRREGLADMAAVHAADGARREAERRRAEARAGLAAVAPEGIAALTAAVASLPEPLAEGTAAPSVADAEAGNAAAAEVLRRTEAALETTRGANEQAARAVAGARVAHDKAADRLARARARLGAESTAAELARLKAARDAAALDLDGKTGALKALAAAAPDLAATAAALTRARAIVTNAEEERRSVAEDLRALDERIRLRGAEGIGDELAATEEALARAAATRERWEREVAVLTCLEAALRSAQREARDTYVAPVVAELGPLVELMWPAARMTVDHESLLPAALVRAGAAEDVDVLSGGTREQVALLVRLAFARLLAKAGRPAPIILDDAIVYTDDERIERIFDALTREADGQQIIVFSCRQKAFRDLGGTVLRITPGT